MTNLMAEREPLTKPQALGLFEMTRREFLEHCRWVAKRVAQNRLSRQATIDDVREQVKLPYGIDGRVFGAVFNTDQWEAIGFTKSKQKINHGRPITVFRLKGEQPQLFSAA